jgi:hypothetical protein
MASNSISAGTQVLLSAAALGELIPALQRRGHEVIGPTIRDGAIVYEPIETIEDLPAGYTMQQEGGSCRLKKRRDKALFDMAVSLQNYLHPPEVRVFAADRRTAHFAFSMAVDRRRATPSSALSRVMWRRHASRAASC